MRTLLAFVLLLLSVTGVQAQTLTVSDRDVSRTYTLRELLDNRAARKITIANDFVYRRPMSYRAIPVAELLKPLKLDADDHVQARASDAFSVSIPAGLLLASGRDAKAEAFLAIEDPAEPWAPMPGQKKSAGPLYIVWRLANGAPSNKAISSEYWAYALAALAVEDAPLKRWPQLGVARDVPADDPVRRGLDRFVAVCLACHRFNGAGEGEQGPDLGRPMNPVDYLRAGALKKLIRDPASVRTWPDRKMPGFGPDTLSDSDIDAIAAWLEYKAAHKER